MKTVKINRYRGFIIAINTVNCDIEIYTPTEWAYGEGYRVPEWVADCGQEAIDWIDSAVGDYFE